MPQRSFPVFLIKPGHYDDDGYVFRWLRAAIPSNTLATLYGLVRDCAERRVLGNDVVLACEAYDEVHTRVDVADIVARLRKAGCGLVGIVGVQSNQFPRAMDLARRFRAAEIPVCIGGFHVSGCLSMLPQLPSDLQEALELGISLFGGEAEGRLEDVLRDAFLDRLKPIYNHMDDLPALEGAPTPFLPRHHMERCFDFQTSFDAGRGCPFQCSFCTIINVQGRKSRRRSVDDIERIVRANFAQGITQYFITDDNFARNKDWESILDRLIALRDREGIRIKFTLQADVLCHKTPGFIEKAARAGANKVFIGLENINPEALAGVQKRQNRISDYRTMMQAWQSHGVLVFAGYIIGFPGDTPDSVIRDIGIIQRELPVDFLEFFLLTPLPGSKDHRDLYDKGVWMDPDMNKYDLFHVTTAHPQMSAAELAHTYRRAWDTYYSLDHIETMFRRAYARGLSLFTMVRIALWFYGSVSIEHVHPLEGGYFRRKSRRDRRAGMPRESVFTFYPRYAAEIAVKHWRAYRLLRTYRALQRRIERDPNARTYRDLTLMPASESDRDALDLFAQAGVRSLPLAARTKMLAPIVAP